MFNISPTVAEEVFERLLQMAHTIPVIGIDPAELAWIRMLVLLLRHPDPVVPELTRQALRYLEAAAARSGVSRAGRDTAPAVQG